MDNVIQNININDIIPLDNETNQNELNDLVNSIKKFGIIEPLILKPNNDKYEIVLGNKIYQAAKIAGINLLPAIIKDIDEKTIEEYRTISNLSKDNVEMNNNIPQNNQTSENNSDIVSLQELSKQEYEREDVKMNNEQNNMMNNNIGAPLNMDNQQQEPTFGGKFFPSLEDEPTNMNMGGANFNEQPMPEPQAPVQPNFIDLTDSSATPAPTPQMQQPTEQPMPEQIDNFQNNEQQIAPENMGNTINIDNLTAGYNVSQPAPEMNQNPQPQEPIEQPIPEQITPNNNMNDNIPQFDMSQAVAPNPMMSPDIGLGINGNNVEQGSQQINEEMNMQNYNEPTPVINDNPVPEISNQPMMDNQNMNFIPPMGEESTPITNTNEEVKNVIPVVNTIKALATSLAEFGYQINVTEEELPTSIKVNIEIQK